MFNTHTECKDDTQEKSLITSVIQSHMQSLDHHGEHLHVLSHFKLGNVKLHLLDLPYKRNISV